MAQLDFDLLKLADLSVSEAATLFGRTRQALYAALSKSPSYFKSAHLLTIVQHCTRSDSKKLPAVLNFIVQNYGGDGQRDFDGNLVIPIRTGIQRLTSAYSEAWDIFAFCSRNAWHVRPQTNFIIALTSVAAKKRNEITIVIPEEAWRGYLQACGSLVSSLKTTTYGSSAVDLPIIIGARLGGCRGFAVGKYAIEEMEESDAMALWQHAITTMGVRSTLMSLGVKALQRG